MSYKALNPPPLVRDKPADEVMRAAVLNGELHVSLRLGFNEPAVWGSCSSMRRAMSRASTRTRS